MALQVKWVHLVHQELKEPRECEGILEILVCLDLMELLVKKAKLDHQAHRELRGHKETWGQKV